MKDVKDALYCMGQMADKCLTSLGAIQKDHNEFVSLVRRMREAQKLCDTMASKIENETQRAELLWEIMNDSINLESEVDEYLKKIND